MSLSVHIKKKLGDFLLSVDLEHPGGIGGMLGPSGCGKSMTLKCIAGIVKPDEGQIVLNGRVLFDSRKKINVKPQERRVAYLFQNYALFPNMTVEQNVRCGLCREKDRNIRRLRLEETLKMMELEPCRSLYPRQLSGGQQQRTALARILAGSPELLLLDEPFSALDAYLREQMQTQVRKLLESYGRDVLLVSHSRDEVYYFCSSLSVMRGGCILKTGGTGAVFDDPGSIAAAALTGCKNIAAAEKTGPFEAQIPAWGIRVKTKTPVEDDLCAVGIRAHFFSPDQQENRFPVRLISEREDPFERRILFRYSGQQTDSPDLWWRVPKDRTKGKDSVVSLGVAGEDVLLLYPEKRE